MIRLRALAVFASAWLVRGVDGTDARGLVAYDGGRPETKAYARNDLLELEPPTDSANANATARALQGRTCKPNERLMTFKVATDQYGYETKCEWSTLSGIFARMPAPNRNFADLTAYTFHQCVRVGQQYRLRIKDAGGDGMCCNFGRGSYSIKIGNDVIFDAKRTKAFNTERTHTFRVKAVPSSPRLDNGSSGNGSSGNGSSGNGSGNGGVTPRPTPRPTPRTTPRPTPRPTLRPTPRPTVRRPSGNGVSGNGGGGNSGNGAGGRSGCLTVKVKGDRNPGETSWEIRNRNGAKVASSPQLKALTPVSKKVCLPKGQYEFVMKDRFGDGLCCHAGHGEFFVHMDGRELLRGSNFQREKRFKIQIKPNYAANMSRRDREWLTAHNTRRRKYHAQWGKPYVGLQWSPQLAADAKRWATKLLADCHKPGIEHEPGVNHGENLAKNKGNGKFGQMYPADNIMTRWVEHELTWKYPRNAHLTQCLWRATKYVGCGEAHKTVYNNGRPGTCRTQVCRYARAGNCNMGQYNANVGTNWKKPMLEDYSRCGPDCPPEGCF